MSFFFRRQLDLERPEAFVGMKSYLIRARENLMHVIHRVSISACNFTINQAEILNSNKSFIDRIWLYNSKVYQRLRNIYLGSFKIGLYLKRFYVIGVKMDPKLNILVITNLHRFVLYFYFNLFHLLKQPLILNTYIRCALYLIYNVFA